MPYGTNARIQAPFGDIDVDEAPSSTNAHPGLPLGFEVQDDSGRTYKRVKFGAAVAQYEACQPTATATPTTAVVKTSAANQAVLGVYFHATSAANLDYGWIITKGPVTVKTTGVSAGDALTTGATGGTLATLAAAAHPRIIAGTATSSGTSSAILL